MGTRHRAALADGSDISPKRLQYLQGALMKEEPLFEIDSTVEVERQVDAMFAPLYSLIPENHHKEIVRVERDMINAIKSALRQPATEPVTPNPSNWPWSSGERLMPFLSPEEQREIREIRKRREPN
jgi:hypothetical protein